MASLSRPFTRRRHTFVKFITDRTIRHLTTAVASKKEGDISSVFASLSGKAPLPLPARFSSLKRKLIQGREKEISDSWQRLLKAVEKQVQQIEELGSAIIPSIQYNEIKEKFPDFQKDLMERGAGVIRGVIPVAEARDYKTDLEDYIKSNPSTRAFPPNNPAVYELYWSPAQSRARSHPNLLATQRRLMQTWRSASPDALILPSHPVTYADRVRIRQPGDAGFALGPHVDAGSVERWEEGGYGAGGVYERIWAGSWEDYDPWESSCRLDANTDLYEGPGACSMFRMFQGWLGMSWTGPGEGTLLVNPMLRLATAYYLLRPFFRPVRAAARDAEGGYAREYLEEGNWRLENEIEPVLQGATTGLSQELNEEMHPHLQLSKTMVHIPEIAPGDYVVWHCDAIHAVDKFHQGSTDSSVLYIPACPLTEGNAQYLARQRESFLQGTPGPDFPGGLGESKHIGRPTADQLIKSTGKDGLQALGLEAWSSDKELLDGERRMVEMANELLGFK